MKGQYHSRIVTRDLLGTCRAASVGTPVGAGNGTSVGVIAGNVAHDCVATNPVDTGRRLRRGNNDV